ncbi:hypothetical protein [Aestuariibaculum sediminum]|uniref:Uncharacterized protein n=1 Tax=Aestuariibaculum sediminum TaxID=2770637 RepID=A0A8J6QF41_9FLAO|nr:hypothetical protein [Aestuariibaculum sediminum]MBD0830844.1 hypothetical protein [Aestuariibaculum sediminum]
MKETVRHSSDLRKLITLERKMNYKELKGNVFIDTLNNHYSISTDASTGYMLDFEFEKVKGKYILIGVHP